MLTEILRRATAEDIQVATPHATFREPTMQQEYTMALPSAGRLRRRYTHWLRAQFPRTVCGLSDPHACVCDLQSVDVSHALSVGVVAGGTPRSGEIGPDPDGPRHYDRDWLSGGRGHLQGRRQCAGVNDGGLDLAYRRDWHSVWH